jgi:excisionase family DNA binding protein
MTSLTVKQLSERFSVSQHTVLGWIAAGELRAVNVGTRPGTKRPRWRITEQAVEAFETLRSPTPSPVPTTRRRKRSGPVLEFLR